jgi:hypothetical protein
MGEEPTGVNKGGEGTGRVTITQAAALLGVHPNTVRSRVKAGVYDAEKVLTENGFTWMIDPASLINPPLPNASQQLPSQVVNPEVVSPTELVRDLLTPFVEDLGRVREELGAERVRREQAERERDELRAQLEALQEARDDLETASGVAEWIAAPDTPEDLETASSEPQQQRRPYLETLPSESRQRRLPWWRRWFEG